MDHQELLDRYFEAWNRKSVGDMLRLMDPQAAYHDAFWGESCSGRDLVRYLETNFAGDETWYRQEDEIIDTSNGLIVRYCAFNRKNPRNRKLLYKGAEVMTIEDGLITGISDFYCDPDTVQLLEVATRIGNRRKEYNVAPLGLSAKSSGQIKRRLAELDDNTTVFLDPALTTRRLAERVGCTVAHLDYVLEKDKKTNFPDSRSRSRSGLALI